ncbi:hypothetical protein [Nostoc sp. FACHB-857]|nr:hypothetical protein [Nostoc sp. FACHB-857]MBD2678553.1 hypothetical protein [Nostoc sp. FACHB-857]
MWGLGTGDWGLGNKYLGKKYFLTQCPMPNAQCPMPHAQCPMPHHIVKTS